MNKDIPTIYLNEGFIAGEVAGGRHRDLVGGYWGEIGRLQFDFLMKRGLSPSHRLIDIGCGCLRGGVHFVRHLNAGCYYGIDSSSSLVRAGYELELLPNKLEAKLPLSNLNVNASFAVEHFGVMFDFALAVSVFTHLPLTYLRLCLERVSQVMLPASKFYASFFFAPEISQVSLPCLQAVDVVTYADRDPYHYCVEDIIDACKGLAWDMAVIGEWGHPRNQQMVEFTRRKDATFSS